MLERLLPAMLPRIDLPRALLRGRFMKAAAAIEWNGIPIDTVTLDLLRRHWTGIQDELIAEIDRDYGVFEGRSFRLERWQHWLIQHGIPWPTLETGRLDLIRRHLPADGAGPSRSGADARAAQRPVGHAAGRSCGRQRRPQPHDPVGIPIAHRPLPAEQHEIHFRPERLAAQPDPAAGRLRRRLHRLVPAGARHRGGVVRRCGDAGRLPVRRSLSRIRQAGRRRAGRRHQENPRRRRASCSSNARWRWPTAWKRKAWRSGSASRRSSRATCCVRTAKPIASSGHGPTRPSIAPCCTGSLLTAFGWPIHIGERSKPAVAAKLSLPGQRRRDAAAGRLLRHRTGHRSLRPDP